MPTSYIETILHSPLFSLFWIIGLGLALGSVHIKGISLGSSGVIFIALLAGHFGFTIPNGVGSIGLALFVYCVGIGAGGRFFGAIKREGSQLARLALIVVGSGALITWILARYFQLSPAMAAGIFAGSLTSTPALAAATEGAGFDQASDVVVGYGIAYPFGVIGVVLFVQLLPKLLGLKIEDDSKAATQEAAIAVKRCQVEVTNQNLYGKRLCDSSLSALGGCQISRVWRDNRMQPVAYEDRFEAKQRLLLVGDAKAVKIATELIGEPCDQQSAILDADNERRCLVVTERKVVGKRLIDLDTLKQFGVVVTRISRMEFLFVPNMDTRLEKGDLLTVVGTKEKLTDFESVIGHRSQASSETSLISLASGMALGVAIGLVSIPLPWGDRFSLGLAGGPLVVALLLGHFGKVGGILGYIPRPTRLLLQEMGLVFFLANAGVKGGVSIAEAVQRQGIKVFLIGALITSVPMLVGFICARKIFNLSLGQSLGGICGGMTSTPALGAIVSKTSSQTPITSYATVYPVAVILMALLAKLLVQFIA